MPRKPRLDVRGDLEQGCVVRALWISRLREGKAIAGEIKNLQILGQADRLACRISCRVTNCKTTPSGSLCCNPIIYRRTSRNATSEKGWLVDTMETFVIRSSIKPSNAHRGLRIKFIQCRRNHTCAQVLQCTPYVHVAQVTGNSECIQTASIRTSQ